MAKKLTDVTVTVKAVSKTGSIIGTDEVWYSPSKFAEDLPKFKKGVTYDLEIQVNGTYNNIQAASVHEGSAIDEAVIAKQPEKQTGTLKKWHKFNNPRQVGGRDFDKEARGKSRCMLFAAALQCVFVESVEEAIVVAEAGMRYTFDDKPVVTEVPIEAEENPLDTL